MKKTIKVFAGWDEKSFLVVSAFNFLIFDTIYYLQEFIFKRRRIDIDENFSLYLIGIIVLLLIIFCIKYLIKTKELNKKFLYIFILFFLVVSFSALLIQFFNFKINIRFYVESFKLGLLLMIILLLYKYYPDIFFDKQIAIKFMKIFFLLLILYILFLIIGSYINKIIAMPYIK